MVTRRRVIGGVAATAATASLGSVAGVGPAYADYTTVVDPSRRYGTWEGWRSWVTDADPGGTTGRQYVAASGVHLDGKRLVVDIGANTIQTFEVDNVWP